MEFIEALARIADIKFKGSEMEELKLAKKIEYVLDDILPIVGETRKEVRIIIEEFSESEDDY